MQKVRFGRTGLMVSRTSFGCIPILRLPEKDAIALLHNALDAGINLYDTARGYADSEEKLGKAFAGRRGEIILASKTMAQTPEGMRQDLEKSLSLLRTDHLDVYQFHDPSFVPLPGDALYEAMLAFQREGKIRFIGLTNHDLGRAKQAASSGAYDSVQYPLSSLSTEAELELAPLCEEADVGLLAMKALSGGLITNAASAFAFLWQYPAIVPIWGIQHQWELDEFIALSQLPPAMTEEIRNQIAHDREALSGAFCRACGYCLPCPAEIDIPTAARISLLVQRSDLDVYTSPETQRAIRRVRDCIDCGHCRDHCPYHLDTPNLLRSELAKYEDFLRAHVLP